MSQPSGSEIRRFVDAQCGKWNAHDKDGYLNAWQAIAPRGISFEDPVGTPPKTGWDRWARMWDQFNPSSIEQRIEYACVRGDEIALFLYHKATYGGDVTETHDIEVWKFCDGMAYIRCWWDMPASDVHTAALTHYADADNRQHADRPLADDAAP